MYTARVYVPAAYPRELWLAVFDANDQQVLHVAFTPDGDLYAYRGAFRSAKVQFSGVPWAAWEGAVNRALEEVVR